MLVGGDGGILKMTHSVMEQAIKRPVSRIFNVYVCATHRDQHIELWSMGYCAFEHVELELLRRIWCAIQNWLRGGFSGRFV